MIRFTISALVLISAQFATAQIPHTITEYELKRRNWTWTPDSVEEANFQRIQPFAQLELSKLENNLSFELFGAIENVRLDLSFDSTDTIAIITVYTYKISIVKPNKSDKQKFTKTKILEKRVFQLQTKVTRLSNSESDSIFQLVKHINIDKLPPFETVIDDGMIHTDGSSLTIKTLDNQLLSYPSWAIRGVQELNELIPINSYLTKTVLNNNKFYITHETGYCYNSRFSAMSECF